MLRFKMNFKGCIANAFIYRADYCCFWCCENKWKI